MAEFWKRGEYHTNDRSNFVTLWAWSNASTVSTLKKAGVATGYQVPVGKKLIITKMIGPNTGSVGTTYSLIPGYADTDVGFSSGSAGTNYVRLVGTGTASQTPFVKHTTNVNSLQVWEVYLEVPANKYPSQEIYSDGVAIYYEGIEVTP